METVAKTRDEIARKPWHEWLVQIQPFAGLAERPSQSEPRRRLATRLRNTGNPPKNLYRRKVKRPVRGSSLRRMNFGPEFFLREGYGWIFFIFCPPALHFQSVSYWSWQGLWIAQGRHQVLGEL